MKYLIKLLKYSVALLVSLLIAVVFYGKIPLIEGDKTVSKGEIAHFRIGATKAETFETIKTHYGKKGYILKTVWAKSEPFSNELVKLETTSFNSGRNNTEFSEFTTEITDSIYFGEPFIKTYEWRIEIPSEFINSIYLTFSNERLYEITTSRWLFERP